MARPIPHQSNDSSKETRLATPQPTSSSPPVPVASLPPKPIKWSSAQERYILQTLEDYLFRDRNPGISLDDDEAWVDIATDFNARFKRSHTPHQLQLKVAHMAEEYRQYQILDDEDNTGGGGLGWDYRTKRLTSSPELWEELIEDLGPWVRRFRDHSYAHAELSGVVFDEWWPAISAAAEYETQAPSLPTALVTSSSKGTAETFLSSQKVNILSPKTSISPPGKNKRDAPISAVSRDTSLRKRIKPEI